MNNNNRRRNALDAIKEMANEGITGQSETARSPVRRNRAWDRQHSATAMRLYEDDHQWLQAFAAELGISQDAAGRGLLRAIREAVEMGWLEVRVEQQIRSYTDRAGRARNRVETELQGDWQLPQS